MMKIFPLYIGPICFSIGWARKGDCFGIRLRQLGWSDGPKPMITIGGYKQFAICWRPKDHSNNEMKS